MINLRFDRTYDPTKFATNMTIYITATTCIITKDRQKVAYYDDGLYDFLNISPYRYIIGLSCI